MICYIANLALWDTAPTSETTIFLKSEGHLPKFLNSAALKTIQYISIPYRIAILKFILFIFPILQIPNINV